MCRMATLDRRVQVLFDEELYERLLAEAKAERMSVGAFIRDAVETRLEYRRRVAREALERLFASADAHPLEGPLNWEEVKEDHLESPYLRSIE